MEFTLEITLEVPFLKSEMYTIDPHVFELNKTYPLISEMNIKNLVGSAIVTNISDTVIISGYMHSDTMPTVCTPCGTVIKYTTDKLITGFLVAALNVA